MTEETQNYEEEERKAIQEDQSQPPKQKKPRKRQKKDAGPSLVGWYLEAYPLKAGEDGKVAPSYPPTVFELSRSKNLKQAMEQYRKVAETTPDRIADCYCRILRVYKDFRTRTRQVVEIV